MNPLPGIVERFKALFLRNRVERELDEELQYHIDRETEARARAGSPDPRRDALMTLGGVEKVKDEVREARGVLLLEEWLADTRYALRALRRSAGFTFSVLAVWGIGIGAATAVFTVVDRVLLSGLSYPHPERLVRIYQRSSPTSLGTLSVVDLQAIAAQQRSFDAFGGLRWEGASANASGTAERLPVGRVSSGFFRALGVRAAHGRLLAPSDDLPGAAPAVVISSAFAERSFGGSAASAASAVGRAMTIDGVSHQIVGVLEPGRRELAGMARRRLARIEARHAETPRSVRVSRHREAEGRRHDRPGGPRPRRNQRADFSGVEGELPGRSVAKFYAHTAPRRDCRRVPI